MTRNRKRTPWEKIKLAADRGTGLRLTAEDIQRLACDEAIMTRARQDEMGEED